MIRYTLFTVFLFFGLGCQAFAIEGSISEHKAVADRFQEDSFDFKEDRFERFPDIMDEDDVGRRRIKKIIIACVKRINALRSRNGCKPCKCGKLDDDRFEMLRAIRDEDDDDDDDEKSRIIKKIKTACEKKVKALKKTNRCMPCGCEKLGRRGRRGGRGGRFGRLGGNDEDNY